MFLVRLVGKGFLKRLARGIYVRHDCKKKFTAQELGEAKAKRFGRCVTSHAADCAAKMNFIEKGNVTKTFHAQGRSTQFESTSGNVLYRATSPRRVALRDAGIVGDCINALWWLKKRGARERHIQMTLASMNRIGREDFLWSHDLMPGWLSDLVHRARGGQIIFPLKREPK